MKVAYADPPYLGQGKRYIEKTEVDHIALIKELEAKYDAWALSCSTPSLRVLLPKCPSQARVAAWVKPFCAFKKGINPAYAWEAVIFIPTGRKVQGSVRTGRDWVKANITLQTGLVGAKPPEFCYWLLELLGMNSEDELTDLFPGTGILIKVWEIWRHNLKAFEGRTT